MRKARGALDSMVAKTMAPHTAIPPMAPCWMRSGTRRPKSLGPMNDQMAPNRMRASAAKPISCRRARSGSLDISVEKIFSM